MIAEDELRIRQARFEPVRQANQSHYRELEKLRREFVSKFPPSRIPLLSLDDYVEGKGSKDSFFQVTADKFAGLMLQIATSKKGRGGRRKLPLVFTEHGAIMAANVLNSPRAVQMSVFVVRAFVKMREALSQNRHLAEKLAELERRLTGRLDVHEKAIVHILDEIKKLMEPLPPQPEPKRREIGFHVRDEAMAKLCSSRGSPRQSEASAGDESQTKKG
jgi:phage regulator Rha-like protein